MQITRCTETQGLWLAGILTSIFLYANHAEPFEFTFPLASSLSWPIILRLSGSKVATSSLLACIVKTQTAAQAFKAAAGTIS